MKMLIDKLDTSRTDTRNILIISHSTAEATSLINLLEEAGRSGCDYLTVTNTDDLKAALNDQRWDLILCALGIPELKPADVVQSVKTFQPEIPVILTTETVTAQDAIAILRSGARGYVEKSDPQSLIEFVFQELETSWKLRRASEIEAIKNELEGNQSEFNGVLEIITDALVSFSLPDRRRLFASASFEKIYGYPLQCFEDDPDFFKKIIHPDDVEFAVKSMEVVNRQGIAELEHRIIWPNGQVRWLHRRAWLVYDKNGRPVRAYDTARDITANKQAEEELRKSQEKFSKSFMASPDALIVSNLETSICLEVNETYLNLTGLTREQIIGHSTLELKIWAYPEEREPMVRALKKDGFVKDLEFHIHNKAGEIRLATVSAETIELNGERCLIATIQDVTEKKQAELRLRNSEEKYRSLVENSDAVTAMFDADGRILIANELAARDLNLTTEQITGKLMHELFPPQVADFQLNSIRTVIKTGKGIVNENPSIVAGQERWYHTSIQPVKDATGQISAALITSTDITRFKAAEAAMVESEKRYRQLFEAHGLPKLIIEPESGQIVDANPAAAKYYGYDLPALKTLKIFDVHTSSIDEIAEKMAAALNKHFISCEAIHRTAGDVLRDVEVYAGPFEDGGKQYIYLIITDITEKQRAKAELLEAHNLLEQRVKERTAELENTKSRLEAIFNHSGDGILLLDLEQVIQQANPAFDAMVGISAGSHFATKLTGWLQPDDTPTIASIVQEVAKTQQLRRVEARAVRADGSTFEAELNLAPVNRHEQTVTNLVCIIRDITEQKQAQQAIAEERNLLRTVIDAIPDFIYVKDNQGRYVSNNAAHLNFLKAREVTQIYGKTSLEVLPAEVAVDIYAIDQAVLKTGQTDIREEHFVWADGAGESWNLTTKVALRNLQGEISGLVGITHDISKIKNNEAALKRSEQQLRESQDMLQLVLDTIPVRVYWKNNKLQYLGCNRRFARDVGLEQTSEIIGKKDSDIPWLSTKTASSETDDVIVMKSAIPRLDYEETRNTASGRQMAVMTSKLPLKDSENKTIGMLGVYLDVTPRKQAEAALVKKQNEEREMQEYLRGLQDITLLLTNAETLDEFYRIVIDQGLQRFGIDRLGMLLYDKASDTVLGTYGTDADGKVSDERHLRLSPDSLTGNLRRAISRGERLSIEEDTPLYANLEQVGVGQNAIATLLDGEILGWIAADNGVSHKPFTRTQLDILTLYALTTASLLSRKRAEVARRESEERYRTLILTMSEGILLQDGEGKIQTCNAAAERIIGLTADQLMGITPIDSNWQAIHEDGSPFLPDTQPAMVTLATGKPISNMIMGIRKPDDTITWTLINSQPIFQPDQTTPSAVVTTFTDITRRKEAEDNLVATTQRLRLATHTGGIGIWDWNLIDNSLVWDDRMFQLYGASPADFNSTNDFWMQRVHPEDRHLIFAENFALTDRDQFDVEFRIILPDKTIRNIKSHGILIRGHDNTVERMVGVNLDITERKDVEQVLRSALEKEKELGELKSRFVSMASHELRTPLTAILSTTESLMLYRHRMEKGDIDNRLEKIRQRVFQMKEIIEDVLQLSKVQSKRVEFRPSLGDLHELCQEIYEEFDGQQQYQGRLQYDCMQQPVILYFDTSLIRRVVYNLVSNALKYSLGETPVHVELAQDQNQIILKVIDQGIGIPPEDMKHLFQPFHRAENVGTISGTGLGLSIALQLVELHGGTITTESRVGTGSTFTVTLPKTVIGNGEEGEEDGH